LRSAISLAGEVRGFAVLPRLRLPRRVILRAVQSCHKDRLRCDDKLSDRTIIEDFRHQLARGLFLHPASFQAETDSRNDVVHHPLALAKPFENEGGASITFFLQ